MRLAFPDCSDDMRAFLDTELSGIVPDLRIGAGLEESEGLLLLGTRLDARVLQRLPDLRLVVFLSTGVSSWIDSEAALARRIVVRGVRGYGDRSVAEHALALILATMRQLGTMDRRLRTGRWQPLIGQEIAGRRLGVVGLGGTGRALASLGSALGCEVLGWNRTPVTVPGVQFLPLDTLLSSADIVSLHLLLTAETHQLLDARRIGLLKRGAILINTARGGIVDEEALVARLTAGEIAAGLDVFADEPVAPDHPLLALDCVTLSAHAAWNTRDAARNLLRLGLLTLREEAMRLEAGDAQPRASRPAAKVPTSP